MNKEQKISEALHKSTPTLKQGEKEVLWRALRSKLPTSSIPSPYTTFFNTKKHLAPIAFALIFILSGTGVVAAAENSRPGDSLFVIEQKVEDIRLALASDDKKTRLEAEFAAERLLELSSILNESVSRDVVASTSASTTRTEARVSQENEARVNEAVAITLDYLINGSFGEDTRENLLEELSLLIEGVPVKLHNDRLRIEDTNAWVEIREDDDDSESRVEIRDGSNRIRIREKDGEIRIDTKGDWDDEVDEDNKDDRDDSNNDGRESEDDSRDNDDKDFTISNQFEAEADVFSDITVVKVEINDRKSTFETNAKTREAVVIEIANRFGISRTTVEAGLDFEVEDRDTEEKSDLDNEDDDEDDDNKKSKEDDRNDDDTSESDDEGDSEDDDRSENDSTTDIRIEAKVEDGEAEVKVEGSSDDEFTLPYSTKTLLITAIALKTGLSEAIVSSNLDLEFKD